MTGYIVDLHETSKNMVNDVGGKASNLGELLTHSFPVPAGFVVTCDAYNAFKDHNSLLTVISNHLREIDYNLPDSIEKHSQQIQLKIQQSTIPSHISALILKTYSKLHPQVAIRSSATAEDLPTASFAGQQETYLNIKGETEVLEHIKQCYASLWTSRAIAYRHTNAIPHESVSIAIVVQEMIVAQTAGVLFTANPITSARHEILIESSYGLGEAIVSGKVSPDQYVVNAYQDSMFIQNKEISVKEVMATFSPKGIQFGEVPANLRSQSSLTEDQILALAQLGKSIEKSFGNPQDVEWAIDDKGTIHVLQARPITSLVNIAAQEDKILWTRGYSDDYWNDPVSPLFFNLLGSYLELVVDKELNGIMGYKGINQELLKLAYGHVYFNTLTLKLRVENEIPPFLRNDDLLNYFPEGSGQYGKETMKRLPFKIKQRIVGQIRVMLLDPEGSITTTADVYDRWTENEFLPYCAQFDQKLQELKSQGSLNDLLALSNELHLSMMKHYRLVRYALPTHNIGMNLLLNYLLGRFLHDPSKALQYYPILVAGLENKTSQTNQSIHHLADMIISNKQLTDIIQTTPSKEILSALNTAKNPTFKPFLAELKTFLLNFGDRGFTREPYYPRWGDEPAYVFDILKSLCLELNHTSSEHEKKFSIQRRRVENDVECTIRQQRFGLLKWKGLSVILGFARRYLVTRENQRFNLDKWIARNRQLYLAIGDHFVKKSIITKDSEIFFFYRKEIRQLAIKELTDPEKLKIQMMVKKRIEEYHKYEKITPPKFIQRNRAFNDENLLTGQYYRGVPASQGMITGPIHVLLSVEDIASVKSGEILVVPKTDPGWTPVFSKIGGLITETGGVLSHGAVVAREYSVPAVTNVRNACEIFNNVKTATLDGNTGSIKVID